MEAFCPSNYLEGNMCLLSGKKSPCCMYISLVQLAETIYLKLYKCSIITLFVFVNYSVYPASALTCFYYVIGLSLFMHLFQYNSFRYPILYLVATGTDLPWLMKKYQSRGIGWLSITIICPIVAGVKLSK